MNKTKIKSSNFVSASALLGLSVLALFELGQNTENIQIWRATLLFTAALPFLCSALLISLDLEIEKIHWSRKVIFSAISISGNFLAIGGLFFWTKSISETHSLLFLLCSFLAAMSYLYATYLYIKNTGSKNSDK